MRGSDKRAVALKYGGDHPGEKPSGAPRVTAKGRNHMADRIVGKARENGVPVMDIPRLADSLYSVELGEEIPEELYMITAEVIRFVYSLEEKE